MNGGEQKIYDVVIGIDKRLVAIETKQEERHKQNTSDINKLHKTISSVIKLKTHVSIQWWFIGAIFIGILTLFIRSINA